MILRYTRREGTPWLQTHLPDVEEEQVRAQLDEILVGVYRFTVLDFPHPHGRLKVRVHSVHLPSGASWDTMGGWRNHKQNG